jgi:hypothetical protein
MVWIKASDLELFGEACWKKVQQIVQIGLAKISHQDIVFHSAESSFLQISHLRHFIPASICLNGGFFKVLEELWILSLHQLQI